MSAVSVLKSTFRINFHRYIRSPAILFVALAVPIAAHYMLPDADAAYAVLTINGMKPILTSAVLGLELGVLAATLLTPLAYIFLRAGPTRRQPWQISDVTPHSRVFAALGRWASDTAALWILLSVLTIAGIILGVFRLEENGNIFDSVVALWLPAAPALSFVAAIKIFLDARNFTRGWFGDVIFFVSWLALMIVGIVGATDPETQLMISKPFSDVFGFTAPIIGSIDSPVNSVTIGGATNIDKSVMIDAWQGITNRDYLTARLLWLSASAGLAIIAGLIWAPVKARQPKQTKNRNRGGREVKSIPIRDIPFLAPTSASTGSTNYAAAFLSEIKLMLKNRVWLICLGVTAIIGLFLPFRTVAAPAILLALIFPLTEASSRWQVKSMASLLNTMGTTNAQRAIILYLASAAVAALVLTPAIVQMSLQMETKWMVDLFAIIFIAPAVILATGQLTRSAVTGRMIMLIIWYVYLSSAAF